MQLHDLQRNSANRKSRRIGRGGKRGKTAGRGTKGQRARAGHRMRPEMRDTIKKLPKRRGYGKNRARTVNALRARPAVVNLDRLEHLNILSGFITPEMLVSAGLVKKRGGRIPQVKILGGGALSKKISLSGFLVSEAARGKIESSGGVVQALAS